MVVEQLDSLYREVILDHFREPRNAGELAGATVKVDGANPLCGDEMTLWLKIDGGRIADVRFIGKGCAISQAAASMLTEQIKGVSVADTAKLIAAMKAMMQGDAPDASVDLGDLEALAGVRKFPVRVKCAALSWNVLEDALEQARR